MKSYAPIHIVWMKRDLRTSDHEPLNLALAEGLPVLVVFLFEPALMQLPDTSHRHLAFQYQSALQVQQKFSLLNIPMWIAYADAPDFFRKLITLLKIRKVYSYQETGVAATWERDKAVAALLRSENIMWVELPRDGIVRGLRSRLNWDVQLNQHLQSPLLRTPTMASRPALPENPFALSPQLQQQLVQWPSAMQPPGEDAAWRYLKSFLEMRGKLYSRHISRPAESRTSCSRLSPYLSWGNISLRQVYNYTMQLLPELQPKKPILDFLTRLRWRSHFIQKLESEMAYENSFINRGFEFLTFRNDPLMLKAWEEGNTGFPLVDACMRCLHATGWVNFRMRAMLVSFLSHHLFIDWRLGVHHLARLFLDYEPGIHYPQFQMQAGTTGLNTLRIYNPVKNALKLDPEASFVKKWIPQLAALPPHLAHQPWLLTPMEQQLYNFRPGIHYPSPIVPPDMATREARQQLWEIRKSPLTQSESERIKQRHVRPSK